ncbi:MAG: hypothetical protein FWC36_08915 [Spirochaetes bacterium]|nr:hypothetical protein [Spirochaetota bacterium]
MKIGDWYREQTFNLKNGKEEWKYYNVKNIILENNNAEIDVYKIFCDGNISAPRQYTSPIEVFENCTKLSAEYAYSELKIKPPEEE